LKENFDDSLTARLRGDLLTIASRVSHDLRTPLSGIVSTAEAIKEILAENDPTAASLADSLITSADEITQLIKQVNFVVKASIHEPAKESVPMGDVLWRAVQRLESKLLRRHITLQQPDEWPQVWGVADWFEMIWWDLLVYLLRPERDHFTLELGWRLEKQNYRFWIKDKTAILSPERREKLFQSFDSLHQSDGGTALELSIVRRLVELSGGTCGHEGGDQGGLQLYFDLASPGSEKK
jgi:signal transduction histidine kinase